MGYGNGNPSGAPLTGYSGNYDSPSPATKSPQVAEQVKVMEDRLIGLGSLVDELYARLESVLMPEPPTVQGNATGVPAPPAAPLANALSSFNARLSMNLTRLQSLAHRIEL